MMLNWKLARPVDTRVLLDSLHPNPSHFEGLGQDDLETTGREVNVLRT